jgi:hypothetical protein
VQAGGRCIKSALGRRIAAFALSALGLITVTAAADSVLDPAIGDDVLGDHERVMCRIGEAWLMPDQLPLAQAIIYAQRNPAD